MKLVLYTQVWENYGEPDKPCWKAKGGSDYIAARYSGPVDIEIFEADAKAAEAKINVCNDMFEEYVIGWEVLGDAEPTPWERDQLEFDGTITYPTKDLTAITEAA